MPTLTHEGATLHYQPEGETGEPVLMIQGVGVIGNGWLPQARLLRDRHRVVTFDNRGIGQSTPGTGPRLTIELMARDALAVARHAGWESFHVVGHSMGGLIAQRLALTAPGAVRSLTLLCTVSRGADAVRLTPAILSSALRLRVGPRAARRRAFLELIYPGAALVGRDCDALASELAPLFGRDLADQPPILMKQAGALRRHDCTPELSAITGIRTLVVSAAHDILTPARCGRALAAAIPGASYVELPDAAHGAPMHLPAVITSLIERTITADCAA